MERKLLSLCVFGIFFQHGVASPISSPEILPTPGSQGITRLIAPRAVHVKPPDGSLLDPNAYMSDKARSHHIHQKRAPAQDDDREPISPRPEEKTWEWYKAQEEKNEVIIRAKVKEEYEENQRLEQEKKQWKQEQQKHQKHMEQHQKDQEEKLNREQQKQDEQGIKYYELKQKGSQDQIQEEEDKDQTGGGKLVLKANKGNNERSTPYSTFGQWPGS